MLSRITQPRQPEAKAVDLRTDPSAFPARVPGVVHRIAASIVVYRPEPDVRAAAAADAGDRLRI
jgi:hypothetical protein